MNHFSHTTRRKIRKITNNICKNPIIVYITIICYNIPNFKNMKCKGASMIVLMPLLLFGGGMFGLEFYVGDMAV